MTKKHGWTRLSAPDAPGCFRHFRYEPNGCEVLHCGHPTANFPYYLQTKDGRMIVAPNGRGFRLLKDAQAAAERIEARQ